MCALEPRGTAPSDEEVTAAAVSSVTTTDAGASAGANSSSSPGSAPSSWREVDLQRWRQQQASDQESRVQQREAWENQAQKLEEEVAARRSTLESALELRRNRAHLLREEHIEREHLGIVSELNDAQEEAAWWREEACRRASCVWELQSALAKELLNVERRWSDAVTKRARCLDLEASLEERTVQSERLSEQIHALERRIAIERQEAESTQNCWALQREELDFKLHNARQAAEEVRANTRAWNLNSSTARGRELKQLRAKFHNQASHISAAAECWRMESEEIMERAASSRPGRRRGAGDPATGRKAAALRTAWHRQEEQGRRKLLELQAEIFREQMSSEAESKEDDVGPELRVSVEQARSHLQEAEQMFSAVSATESRQEAELQDMEARFMAWPSELVQRLAALGVPALEESATLPLLCKSLWPSPEQAAEVAQVAATARAHSKTLIQELTSEHVTQTELWQEESSKLLHETLTELRHAHNEELTSVDTEQRREVYLLREELLEERAQERTNQHSSRPDESGGGVAEIETIAAALEHQIRQLREDHSSCLAVEGVAHAQQLQQVLKETDAAEKAYLKLRRALVEACQEAEYQHERDLEDQEIKHAELAELYASQSTGNDFSPGKTAKLTDTVRASEEPHGDGRPSAHRTGRDRVMRASADTPGRWSLYSADEDATTFLSAHNQ